MLGSSVVQLLHLEAMNACVIVLPLHQLEQAPPLVRGTTHTHGHQLMTDGYELCNRRHPPQNFN